MLTLFFTLIVGLALAFFATQNAHGVSIRFIDYEFFSVPLYIVVLSSMLLGIFVSWLISLIGSISSSLTIHNKNTVIDSARKSISDLEQKIHDLELENARLKGERHEEIAPPFFDRLRHRFA